MRKIGEINASDQIPVPQALSWAHRHVYSLASQGYPLAHAFVLISYKDSDLIITY